MSDEVKRAREAVELAAGEFAVASMHRASMEPMLAATGKLGRALDALILAAQRDGAEKMRDAAMEAGGDAAYVYDRDGAICVRDRIGDLDIDTVIKEPRP